MTASSQLADFSSRLQFRHLPTEVVADARHRLLDIVGLCLAVSRDEGSRRITREVSQWTAKGDASVIGNARGFDPAEAALVNGIFAHTEDFDDTHADSNVHASACVVPAALALAEHQHASGQDLIRAIAVGLECAIRVGLAAPGAFHARGFHTTAIAGPFGATLAAASLLKLESQDQAHALGITGSMASGIFEFLVQGATVKRAHVGLAGRNGITAARLAHAGVTGPPTVFEGRFGLYQTHTGKSGDMNAIAVQLGDDWQMLGLNFKAYPCCHFLHALLDAFSELRRQHGFSVVDIQSCHCYVAPAGMQVVAEPWLEKLEPKNGYAAKFSLPYSLAALALKGEVGRRTYEEIDWQAPEMQAFMQRVSCEPDRSNDAPNSFGAGIEIALKGGQILSCHKKSERRLTESDLVRKFNANASGVVESPVAAEIVEFILSLEKQESLDRLSALLVAAS